MNDPTLYHMLRAFRDEVYAALGARRDALFEALDAATTVGPVPPLPYLSLAALHRRGWGSLYAALAEGSLDVAALRALVGRYPLDDGQPIDALDTSIWPRNDAETSPERGYYYSAARQSAGHPIVAGWSYAWLAQVSFTHDSWTAPLDVRRVPPPANGTVRGARPGSLGKPDASGRNRHRELQGRGTGPRLPPFAGRGSPGRGRLARGGR